MAIKILIADDHQIMREGLRSMLNQEPDFEVIGEAENGREALEIIEKTFPNVVIMDINMPDMNGTEATRQIHAKYPDTRVIALSMHSDRFYVSQMLKAGASGYLLKDCSKNDIIKAVRVVAKNKSYLSPEITGIIIEDYVQSNKPEKSEESIELTKKEREILQLLTEGKTSKEIASQLNIAQKTVEAHRVNIMKKLNIHNVAELTKYAIRHGITCLDS